MVYFKMQDLIGRDCVEAYNEYVRITTWLNYNIHLESWSLNYTSPISINGYYIPHGIKFYNLQDAIYFIRSIA